MWKFGGLVLIAGCTTVPVSYDSNLLKLCEEPTGLRGDTGEMEIEMKKRILADSFYVKNWSLTLDIVIILKTILLVIKGDQKAI
jgi:hypothetical protein